MRRMTEEEIRTALSRANWASICTVGPDMGPYAVEATYFMDDQARVCFMINPRGTTAKNVGQNTKTLVKITLATPELDHWLGVSCFGQGRVETDPGIIARGWEQLGRVMGCDYSAAAEKFAAPGKRSPMLTVAVEAMTGRCSYKKNEAIEFGHWPEIHTLP